jgi:hypothetical protein
LKIKNNLTYYNENYFSEEELPKQLLVRFEEVSYDKFEQVRVTVNDVRIGDILDDNSYKNDGYRFHDVFHFSFAALLGWSPCSRSMLRKKRKSSADTDRIEDGARAEITEEAISLMIFNYALENDYFINSSQVDDVLLTMIKKMVEPFEVRDKSKEDWQDAIIKSYELFRFLKLNKGGIINFNLENKNITCKKIN